MTGPFVLGSIETSFDQIGCPTGARVEPLRPHATSVGAFLREGLHRLTFKIEELASALESVISAGFLPLGTQLDEPRWWESFLHPRDAVGRSSNWRKLAPPAR